MHSSLPRCPPKRVDVSALRHEPGAATAAEPGGNGVSLVLPGGNECFWDPLGECAVYGCSGYHGYDTCDTDGCECPDGIGHRHREFLAVLPAAQAIKKLADDAHWATYGNEGGVHDGPRSDLEVPDAR